MLHLNPLGYDRLASALYRALDGFENRLQKPTRKLAPKARIDAPASRWLMADEAAALRGVRPLPNSTVRGSATNVRCTSTPAGRSAQIPIIPRRHSTRRVIGPGPLLSL